MNPIPSNYVPGDPYYARRVRWFALAIVFITGLTFFWLWSNVDGIVDLAETEPATAAAKIYSFGQQIAWLMWAVGIIAGIWLLRFAWRVSRAGRYPIPGTKVIKATRIREGAEATTVAIISAVVGLAAMGGAIYAGLLVLAAISNIPPPPAS